MSDAIRGSAGERLRVTEITAAATHDLRFRVLRDGRPGAEVTFPDDDRPATVHLGVTAGATVVAVATFAPVPTPALGGLDTWQLRGMAVEPSRQGTGAGRALLEAGTERLRAAGVDALWANARDSALGFYHRLGWQTVGGGFTGSMDLPHHLVVLELVGGDEEMVGGGHGEAP